MSDLTHLKKLAEAMEPDPREWVYEGECYEAPGSHCTCGCKIIYVFMILRRRDGKKLPIGSVCIEGSIPFLVGGGAMILATDLRAALDVMKQRKKEKKRLEREAGTKSASLAHVAELKALQRWQEGEKAMGGFCDPPIRIPPQECGSPFVRESVLRCHLQKAYRVALGRERKIVPPLPADPRVREEVYGGLLGELNTAKHNRDWYIAALPGMHGSLEGSGSSTYYERRAKEYSIQAKLIQENMQKLEKGEEPCRDLPKQS